MSLTKPIEPAVGADPRTRLNNMTADSHRFNPFGKKPKKPKPHHPGIPIRARMLEFCSNVLGLDIPVLCQWARNTIAQGKSAREEEAVQLVKKLQKELRKIAKSQNKKPTGERQQKIRILKLDISEAQDKLREAEMMSKVDDLDQQMIKLETELKALAAQALSLKGKAGLSAKDKSSRAALLRDLQVKKTVYEELLKQREVIQPRVIDIQPETEPEPEPPQRVHNTTSEEDDQTVSWLKYHQSSFQNDVDEFIMNSPLSVGRGERCHYSYHACGADCEGIDLPAFSPPGAAGQTRDQIATKVSLMHMAATGVLDDTVTQVLHDSDLKWRVDVQGKAVVMHHGPYTDLVLAKNPQGQARPVLLMRKQCQGRHVTSSPEDTIISALKEFAAEGHNRGCVGVAFLEESQDITMLPSFSKLTTHRNNFSTDYFC